MKVSSLNSRTDGARLPAQDIVGEPLLVRAREYRVGIKTKYQPDGGPGVIVDIAKINTGEIFVDTLWMNARIVDQLKAQLGEVLPVKVMWQQSQRGGNPWLQLERLEGADLAAAEAWAAQHDRRFETELELVGEIEHPGELVADAPATKPVTAPPAKALSELPLIMFEGPEGDGRDARATAAGPPASVPPAPAPAPQLARVDTGAALANLIAALPADWQELIKQHGHTPAGQRLIHLLTQQAQQ